jgi:hypothetical protein
MRQPATLYLLVLASCLSNGDLASYSQGESPAPSGAPSVEDPDGAPSRPGEQAAGAPNSEGASSGGSLAVSAGASSATLPGDSPPEGAASSGAGGSGDGEAPPVPNEPPSAPIPGVQSLVPPDRATGVASDAAIVITFSQAMDTRSVEAAYRSDTLPPDQVTFAWSAGDQVLTITPIAALRVASGTDPVQVTAEQYAYGVAGGAQTAGGEELAGFEVNFATLRAISTTLAPVPDNALTGNWRSDGVYGSFTCAETGNQICIGDGTVAANAFYRAWVSFDLGSLPALAKVTVARLLLSVVAAAGQPFGTLGPLELEHVDFDAIGPEAFGAEALRELGVLATAAGVGSNLSASVLEAVNADLEQDDLSQFRLRFQNGTDGDNQPDFVTLARNGARLSLTYLTP